MQMQIYRELRCRFCGKLLAKAMAESKGKVMLSINDHPDIRALFKDFRITQLELAYTIGKDKTGKTSGELVICNW